MDMRNLAVAVSFVLLAIGTIATAANARARCDGNFELVQGSWVATRACQEQVAERIARQTDRRISEHPSGPYEGSAEEFCRGNPNIEVSSFCAQYRD